MTDDINTGEPEKTGAHEKTQTPETTPVAPERKSLLNPLTKEEAYREAEKNHVSPELTKILIEKKNLVVGVVGVMITALACFSLGVAFGASEASQLSHDRSMQSSWQDSQYGGTMKHGDVYESYRQGFRDGYNDSRYQYPGWDNEPRMYPNSEFGMTAEPPAGEGTSAPADAGFNPNSAE